MKAVDEYFIYKAAYDDLVSLKSYADEMFNSRLNTLEIIDIKEKVWQDIRNWNAKYGEKINLKVEYFKVFNEAFTKFLRDEISRSQYILCIQPLEKRFSEIIEELEKCLEDQYWQVVSFYEKEIEKTEFAFVLNMPEIKEMAIDTILNN